MGYIENLLNLVSTNKCECFIAYYISNTDMIQHLVTNKRDRVKFLRAAAGHLGLMKLLLLDTEDLECAQDLNQETHTDRLNLVRAKIRFNISERDEDGMTILHYIAQHAVESQSYDVLQWACDRDKEWGARPDDSLWFSPDSAGKTPLDWIFTSGDAFLVRFKNGVLPLLFFEDSYSSIRTQHYERASQDVKMCIEIAEARFQFDDFVEKLRDAVHSKSKGKPRDVQAIIDWVSQFEWFNSSESSNWLGIDEVQHEELFGELIHACVKNDLEVVKLLIEQLKTPLEPPEGYSKRWDKFVALTDHTVLGDFAWVRGVENRSDEETAWPKERAVVHEDESLAMSIPTPKHLKEFGDPFCSDETFGTMCMKWDGKSSLQDFAAAQIKDKKDDASRWKVGLRFDDSVWRCRLDKSNQIEHAAKVEVISCLVSKSSIFLPRLELIVLMDALPILEWLIEQDHLNLNSILKHEVEIIEDSDDEDEEEDEDSTCPICLGSYKNRKPFTLPCGHTFCAACIDLEVKFRPEPKCGMCRVPIRKEDVSQIGGVLRRFLTEYRYTVSWFDCDMNWTAAEMIFMFAVSNQSIHIMKYLIENGLVDPLTVKTKSGHNAMRVAVDGKKILVMKYLCENGFASLAFELSPYKSVQAPALHVAGEQMPLQYCQYLLWKCMAQHGFDEFKDLLTLILDSEGNNYMFYLMQSKHESTEVLRDQFVREVGVKELPKLIEDGESFETIRDFLVFHRIAKPRTSIEIHPEQSAIYEKFMESIIKHSRIDVFKWIFLHCSNVIYFRDLCYPFQYPNEYGWFEDHLSFADLRKQIESAEVCEKREEFIDFLDKVKEIKEIHTRFNQINCEVHKMFNAGGSVADVRALHASAQKLRNDLMMVLDTDVERAFLDEMFGCRQKEINIRQFHHGMPLRGTIKAKHYHLAKWIIDEYDSDSYGQELQPLLEHFIMAGDHEAFQFLRDYVEDKPPLTREQRIIEDVLQRYRNGEDLSSIMPSDYDDEYGSDSDYEEDDEEDEEDERVRKWKPLIWECLQSYLWITLDVRFHRDPSEARLIEKLTGIQKMMNALLETESPQLDFDKQDGDTNGFILIEFTEKLRFFCDAVEKNKITVPDHLSPATLFKSLVAHGANIYAVAGENSFCKAKSLLDRIANGACEEGYLAEQCKEILKFLVEEKGMDNSHLSGKVKCVSC